MNVVLAAEESPGLRLLEALARGPHRLVAVLAAPSKPDFAGANVWNVAKHLGIETWPAEQVRDPKMGERLRSERVDILLNAHSLYRVSEELLSAPRIGAFNLHPGPLPRYAGRNVVSWAIFRGESVHGVTVHRMQSEIDAGPIAYQSLFPIEADDTALSLSLRCSREGVALMLRLLDVAAEDPASIPVVQQDLSQREYFGSQVPEQGWFSWSWPARRITDFVRACDYLPFRSPWGHPRTRWDVQELALVKAHRTGLPCRVSPGTVGESSDSGVQVASHDEWVLVSKLLLSGRYVSAQEVLRRGDRVMTVKADMQFREQKIVEAKLLTLFCDVLQAGVPSVETDLFESGILDSQRFVELLLQIERHFNTRIDLDDFEIENFRCIGKIASLILNTNEAVKRD